MKRITDRFPNKKNSFALSNLSVSPSIIEHKIDKNLVVFVVVVVVEITCDDYINQCQGQHRCVCKKN